MLSSYRSKLERVTKDIAAIEKQISSEGQKLARLSNELASIGKSNSSSQASRMQSKYREINTTNAKISDLRSKIAGKYKELHSTQTYVEREEAKLRKKSADEVKQNQTDRLRAEKKITEEIKAQNRQRSAAIPPKIRVVFCAANPSGENRLHLDEEVRAIQNKIRESEHRDRVDIQSRWAMRVSDFMLMMNEVKPHVVHFSGHGDTDGSVIFVTDDRQAHAVSFEALTQIIRATTENLRAVIFNACFSEAQAASAVECVEVAIGMQWEIPDEAAITFAAHFYSAIGFGKSVKNAFDQGIAALGVMHPLEKDNPKLYSAENVDPETTFLVDTNAQNEDLADRGPSSIPATIYSHIVGSHDFEIKYKVDSEPNGTYIASIFAKNIGGFPSYGITARVIDIDAYGSDTIKSMIDLAIGNNGIYEKERAELGPGGMFQVLSLRMTSKNTLNFRIYLSSRSGRSNYWGSIFEENPGNFSCRIKLDESTDDH